MWALGVNGLEISFNLCLKPKKPLITICYKRLFDLEMQPKWVECCAITISYTLVKGLISGLFILLNPHILF